MGLEQIARRDFERYRGLVRQWHSKKDAFTVACMATIMAVPVTALSLSYAKGDYFDTVITGGITVLAAYGAIRAGQRYRKAQRAVYELELQLGDVERLSARPIETPGI